MLSRFFIDRPIFAGVVAIVMLLSGAIAAAVLPVEQYPQIAPPTVQVTTVYPGADAQTIAETVAAPLEQQVNGVDGMIYMESISANDGSYTLTVTFELWTDLDLASVRVQNRVAIAEPRLPEEVRRQGLVTRKQSTSLLMVLAPHSPDGRYDQLYLSNYVTINMKDALSRVPGVGRVTVFGAKDYAMRVWLDPDRLASRRLTTNDVIAALREQNVQVAAGRLGAEPTADETGFQLTLRAKGRLRQAEEFADIVLKVGDRQATVRLGDVARVELGAQDYDSFGRFGGMPSPVVGIFQLPGSNALEVSSGVREKLDELRGDFPPGFESPVFYDFTRFVRASLVEVVRTLVIAAGLVFVTVFVFLQDWRATLIPGAAIPVSIVGTLAVLLAIGYSLNMLTLFGLVLAIGIVVDDAIVVVENAARLIDEEGLDPKDAARRSMRQITGPIVATTLVLLAVFVPTAVLPGVTGQLYRQFGVTLSVATVLSSINALTLSPALCGVLLRPSRGRPFVAFRAFNAALRGARSSYLWAVRLTLRAAVLAVLLFVVIGAGAGAMLRIVPGGFLPREDQSYLFVNAQLPDAAKLARTDEVLAEIEDFARTVPGVDEVVTIGGFSLLTNAAQSNTGTCVVVLEPWDERGPSESLEAVMGALGRRFSEIPEAVVFPFAPPAIQGLGNAGGFDMRIQDRGNAGPQLLQTVADDVVDAARRSPRISDPFTPFRASVPQLFVDVDRVKAKRLGVPLTAVFETLQTQLGAAYVNDFNIFGRVYQVRAQADAPFRQEIEDVADLEVRDAQGQTIPIGTLADVRRTVGPSTVFRYNLFPSAAITGSAAPGVSSDQAMRTMRSIAQTHLPPSFGYEWSGMSYQEQRAGRIAPIVFALAIVFVFLFLAAQYESWITPITIMMTIPVGVLGALLATFARGLDNNVYTQIGLVLLIALVSKNAILIVEFAEIRRRAGQTLCDAVLQAAHLRFRPILMTALSFVLGTTPLLIATGAGAAARRSIGTAVFGGMVLATFVGVFLIPTLYFVIRWLVVRLAGTGEEIGSCSQREG